MKLRISVEGKAYIVEVEFLDDDGPRPVVVETPASGERRSDTRPIAPKPASTPPPARGAAGAAVGDVQSPIAGTVVSVAVKVGDDVVAKDPLVVLEAMKMESQVVSPLDGVVRDIFVAPGNAVQTGQILVRIG